MERKNHSSFCWTPKPPRVRRALVREGHCRKPSNSHGMLLWHPAWTQLLWDVCDGNFFFPQLQPGTLIALWPPPVPCCSWQPSQSFAPSSGVLWQSYLAALFNKDPTLGQLSSRQCFAASSAHRSHRQAWPSQSSPATSRKITACLLRSTGAVSQLLALPLFKNTWMRAIRG